MQYAKQYNRLIGLIFLFLSLNATAKETLLNQVAVVVNSQAITTQELSYREQAVLQQMQNQGINNLNAQGVRKQVQERLIDEKLQLQAAEDFGLAIDSMTLDQAIQSIAKDNNMSLAEFKNKVEKEGIGYHKFRQDLKNDLLIQQAQQRQLRGQILVTEKEVAQQVSRLKSRQEKAVQYHLGHILIALPESPSPKQIQTAKETANQLAAELTHKDSSFRKQALEHSDSQTALEGGDLGWRTIDELPSLFTEAVPNMQDGEVIGPLKNSSGFHLIKLFETKSTKNDALIQQARVSHILLHTDPVSDDHVISKRLGVIRDKIIAGESFAHAAATYSEDSNTANQGGDLGWITPGDMGHTFERMVNETPLNTVSEPFRTSYGWQLLIVTDKREQAPNDELLKEQARRLIFQRRFQEALNTWLSELRGSAHIVYKD